MQLTHLRQCDDSRSISTCVSKMSIDSNQARGEGTTEARADLLSAGSETIVRFNKNKLS